MSTKAVHVCPPDTPEWLAERNNGVGASEAAAVFGRSRYCSPRELYGRKRGELPPVEETLPMRVGHWMEPGIAAEFEWTTGIGVVQRSPGLYRHGDVPCVLATPDALLANGCGGEWKWVGYTGPGSMADELGADGTDEIPDEWLLQAHQQIAVMGFPAVHFAVLVAGRELRTFVVERDSRLVDGILDGVARFWGRVQGGDPPPWDTGDPRALESIRAAYRTVDGEVRTLSHEAAEAVAREKELKESIRLLEAERDQARALYLAELEGAGYGVTPDGSAMVARKVVARREYTVAATEYVTATVRKPSREVLAALLTREN